MKSEVTRKNDVYAFATSTSRAKNTVRVCACQIPIAAKSEPSDDERDEECPREPGCEWAARDDGEAGDERENEERERDSSRPLVPRPEERCGREGDERRERQREQERRRWRALSADHPIGERERGGRDDEVQREEEEGASSSPSCDGMRNGADCEESNGHRRPGSARAEPLRAIAAAAPVADEREPGRFREEKAMSSSPTSERPRPAGRRAEEREPGEREEVALEG